MTVRNRATDQIKKQNKNIQSFYVGLNFQIWKQKYALFFSAHSSQTPNIMGYNISHTI
jgi:hypothetical protein